MLVTVTQCLAACPGYTPRPEVQNAAAALAAALKASSPGQIYGELCGLLTLASAEELICFAPILAAAVPELAPTIGFDQRSPHHAYHLFTHIAHVTGSVPPKLPLRWAALLHDVGKVPCFTQDETGRGHFYGHAEVSAEMASGILRRLKAPASLRENTVLLIRLHMTKIPPERNAVCRWLDYLGADTLKQLLQLQEADMCSKGMGRPPEADQFSRIRDLIVQESI